MALKYDEDGGCHNSQRHWMGQECGKPARWIGTKARPIEVINDANGELINLWRCARRHPDALAEALLDHGFGRATFARHRSADLSSLTDIERAARFVQMQMCRFGGRLDRDSFVARHAAHEARPVARWRARFQRVAERLSGAMIEARDFEAVMAKFDGPGTLFYLDPPYWGSADACGRGCFSEVDFKRLRAALDRLKGRFIMSINDCPEVRALFKGFKIRPIETKWPSRNGVRGKDQKVTELLISG